MRSRAFQHLRAPLRDAVEYGARSTYKFRDEEIAGLAQRFCRRFRWWFTSARSAQWAPLLIWLFALSTNNVPGFLYPIISPDPNGVIPLIPRILLALLHYLILPVLYISVTHLAIVRHCNKIVQSHIAARLCFSCGYPLPSAPAGGDDSITCPECGQQYVLRRHLDVTQEDEAES